MTLSFTISNCWKIIGNFTTATTTTTSLATLAKALLKQPQSHGDKKKTKEKKSKEW